jgi:hypothetical protein
MPVPGTCTNCKYLEGKTYGGNLLVCGMHPYGPSGETCGDFEKGDRPFNLIDFLAELKRVARECLEEFYPQYERHVVTRYSPHLDNAMRLDVELTQGRQSTAQAFFRGVSVESRTMHIGIWKDMSEWRSLKESGTLRDWIERWLEGEILARSEPVESNRPGGEEEEFWQNIRSALARDFPGSGEWSCRKDHSPEPEYLPSH